MVYQFSLYYKTVKCQGNTGNTFVTFVTVPRPCRPLHPVRSRLAPGTAANNCLTSIKCFIIYKEEVHRKFSKNFQSNVLTNEGKKNIL